MKMSAPEFWYSKEVGLSARVLAPASFIYEKISESRQAKAKAVKVSVPVICVGNVTVGGGGKTPSSIMLMSIIKSSGLAKNPFFLTRGFGRNEKNTPVPFMVDPGKHSYKKTGDEALLLASHGKVAVDHDRVRGAEFAIQNGADLIIMDDGMQHPYIHKDFTVLMVDGAIGFGNGRLIPAGPLREKISSGLNRTNLVIIQGEDTCHIKEQIPKNIPVLSAKIKIKDGYSISSKQKYLAFAGIARPKKFLESLKSLNANIVEWIEFPDHHVFSEKDINDLLESAKKYEARLITTEKDYMRLKELDLAELLEYVPVEMELCDNAEKILPGILSGALTNK